MKYLKTYEEENTLPEIIDGHVYKKTGSIIEISDIILVIKVVARYKSRNSLKLFYVRMKSGLFGHDNMYIEIEEFRNDKYEDLGTIEEYLENYDCDVMTLIETLSNADRGKELCDDIIERIKNIPNLQHIFDSEELGLL